MNDKRPLSYGIITTLFSIAMVTILMRIWVRKIALQAFSWDDWMMASMVIFFPMQQALLYFFLDKGAGEHIEVVMATRPKVMTDLLKGLLVEEFYYVWMQFGVKLCFLLSFFRIFGKVTLRIPLLFVTAFHVGSTIAIWLLYALQCRPLKAFYHPELYPNVKCISNNIAYFIPYSLNLFVDLCIFLLPLSTIFSLKMSTKRKLAASAVITAGGSAVLCGALRAIVLLEFAKSTDFTWALGKMVIISAIEIDMGIIAANMPAVKTFYQCWWQGKLGPGQGKNLDSSNPGQAYGGSPGGALELSSNTPRLKTRGAVKGPQPSDSEEELCGRLPGQKPNQTEDHSSCLSEGASTWAVPPSTVTSTCSLATAG
ncbi:hypothetical protein FPOAC2_13999 [Fusarium poae]|uniref:Rhodopsin domain-containing protein n=1 Tax=Fusarium poae TaxID=36050 RepID=A0A1B8A4L3_FUSPO|nr:hypothetical protein FPOA_13749 [Fusarium poae]OBS17203.1 hypothetical protein FPOA_12276 [Fusarium poae]